MAKQIKPLTRAEEEIMQVLWQLEAAFVKDIIAHLPEPKPAYNTVSTIVRILEKKDFVTHESFGKSHQYKPLITKESYSEYTVDNLVTNYFGGSFEKLVSFFVSKKDLDLKEAESLLHELQKTREE